MEKTMKPGDEPTTASRDVSPMKGDETAVSDRETRGPESIAQRAYERFRMRGGEHGHDQEDWFEAERELNRTERG